MELVVIVLAAAVALAIATEIELRRTDRYVEHLRRGQTPDRSRVSRALAAWVRDVRR